MNLDILQEVFKEVFKKSDIEINPSMTANDIDRWDSITHMKLIAAVEKKFNVDFSYKEVMALKNIGDLLKLVESKI
jgi:acyl carrier protein